MERTFPTPVHLQPPLGLARQTRRPGRSTTCPSPTPPKRPQDGAHKLERAAPQLALRLLVSQVTVTLTRNGRPVHRPPWTCPTRISLGPTTLSTDPTLSLPRQQPRLSTTATVVRAFPRSHAFPGADVGVVQILRTYLEGRHRAALRDPRRTRMGWNATHRIPHTQHRPPTRTAT